MDEREIKLAFIHIFYFLWGKMGTHPTDDCRKPYHGDIFVCIKMIVHNPQKTDGFLCAKTNISD